MKPIYFSIIDATIMRPYKGAIAKLRIEKVHKFMYLVTLARAYIFLLAILHISDI